MFQDFFPRLKRQAKGRFTKTPAFLRKQKRRRANRLAKLTRSINRR